MAKTFEITAPDGKTYEVSGPDDATPEQALAQVQAKYKTPESKTLPANAGMVNLAAFDHNSVPLAFTSVTLVQENDPKPEGYYAEWMPYQVGQAKKHADDKPA